MNNSKSIIKIVIGIIVLSLVPIILMTIMVIFNEIINIEFKLTNRIVLIISFIIIAWLIYKYNKFIRLKKNVDKAKSGIDIYLKQRFDLIPNLVETVKGYTNYEKNILENIVNLRTQYERRNQDDLKQSEDLNNQYTKMLIVIEGYPELKSNELYFDFQRTLRKVEGQLQAARRIYNNEVTNYNISINKFPAFIIAKVFGFKEALLFEIEDNERDNYSIDL